MLPKKHIFKNWSLKMCISKIAFWKKHFQKYSLKKYISKFFYKIAPSKNKCGNIAAQKKWIFKLTFPKKYIFKIASPKTIFPRFFSIFIPQKFILKLLPQKVSFENYFLKNACSNLLTKRYISKNSF